MTVAAALQGLRWGRERYSTRTVRVCIVSDPEFRLEKPNWEYALNLWFSEVNRIFGPSKVVWETRVGGDAYPPDAEGSLQERRERMAEFAACKADVVLGFSGRPSPDARSSAAPFGHTAMIAVAPADTDALTITQITRGLAMLFGVGSSTAAISLFGADGDLLDDASLQLIETLRWYDFERGIDALPGRWEEKAARALATSLAGKPAPQAGAARLLARAFASNRRQDAAVAQFRRAVERYPQDLDLRLEYATQLLRASDPDAAIAQFERAAELDPTDARAHAAIGLIHSNAGRIEEALDELRLAIRIDPANADYQVALGKAAARQLGRTTEAAAAFEAALRLRPNAVAALEGMTLIDRIESGARDVVGNLDAEVRRSPGSSEAHMRLGIAYAAAGDMDKAGHELQRSIELDPRNGLAHLALARWQYLRGEYRAAQTAVVAAEAVGSKPGRVFDRALKSKLANQ